MPQKHPEMLISPVLSNLFRKSWMRLDWNITWREELRAFIPSGKKWKSRDADLKVYMTCLPSESSLMCLVKWNTNSAGKCSPSSRTCISLIRSVCATGYPYLRVMDMKVCTPPYWVRKRNGWKSKSEQNVWTISPSMVWLPTGAIKVSDREKAALTNGLPISEVHWRIMTICNWWTSSPQIWRKMRCMYLPRRVICSTSRKVPLCLISPTISTRVLATTAWEVKSTEGP